MKKGWEVRKKCDLGKRKEIEGINECGRNRRWVNEYNEIL